MTLNNNYGFIIIRHVNSERTNKYWNNSVKYLIRLYPNQKIVIIDDNSNPIYLKSEFEYKNVQVISSEFKGRGELLPYYYYIKNNFFENAVILHDSVFLHKRILFERLYGISVMPLWFFYSDQENINNTLRITHNLKNNFSLIQKLNSDANLPGLTNYKWYGCFGVQSYINRKFLLQLEEKYGITRLVNSVTCRADRCCLERIFGCMFFSEYSKLHNMKSLFGDIRKYQKWGYTYEQYERDVKKRTLPKGVIKVWTGR